MKTILVPTDFSKTSDNAMLYAAALAQKTKAPLVLLHVYQFPFITPEVSGAVRTYNEIEAACLEVLKKRCDKIKARHKSLAVQYLFRFGTVETEIEKAVKRQKAGLVVMGIQGAGYLAEKFAGSVASAMMHTLKCPVLTVGKNTPFRMPKKIALAYDYMPVKKTCINKLNAFAQLTGAKISVVHVKSQANLMPLSVYAYRGDKLEKMLGAKTGFHFVDDENITSGLQQYVKARKPDMLAMLPESHGFFARLFKEPNAKKVAFHTSVPLLTIHK